METATTTKTILVIDDEEQIGRLLRRQLTNVGYNVITAEDAFSGLRKALAHKPDLVVLDICLATSSMGFSVAERMRRCGLQSTPIVFITGNPHPEFRDEAEAAGAVGFFQKPYNPDQLLATIAATLSPPPYRPIGVMALRA